MAGKTIETRIKIALDAADSAKSVGDLKKSMKELKSLALETGEGGKGFNEITLAVGKLNDEMGDLNARVSALSGSHLENLAGGFGKMASAGARGFQAVTGAQALFGVQSKDTLKVIEKLQAASAFAEGIEGFVGLAKGAKAFGVALKAAIANNPIGIILVAIVALGVAIKEISEAWGAEAQNVAKVTKAYEEQKKVSDQLKVTTEARLSVIDAEIALMKAQGKPQSEINAKLKERYEIQKSLLKAELKTAEQAVLVQKATYQKALAEDTLTEALINGNAWMYRKIAAVEEALGMDERAAEANKKAAEFENVLFSMRFEKAKEAKKLEQDAVNTRDAAVAALKVLDLQLETDKAITAKAGAETIKELNKQIEDEQVKSITDKREREIKQIQLDFKRKYDEVKGDGVKQIELRHLIEAEQRRVLEELRIKYQTEDQKIKEEELKKKKEEYDERLKLYMGFVGAFVTLPKPKEFKSKEEEVQEDIDRYNAKLEVAKRFNEGLQGLSDLTFSVLSANDTKYSADYVKHARQQFKINKAIAMSGAIITGIQSVMAAYANGMKNPIPLLGPATATIYAVAAGIGAAANVAKIAATQFDASQFQAPSTGGGAAGGGSGGMQGMGNAPSFNPGDLYKLGTNQLSGGSNTQKSVVNVSEINSVQKKVMVSENRSKISLQD